MSNLSLSLPPTRLAQGLTFKGGQSGIGGAGVNDAWNAREKTVDAITNLNNTAVSTSNAVATLNELVGAGGTLMGNLSFGDIAAGQPTGNLKTILLQGTSPGTANTAFTLTHNLGKIPNGAILVQSNVAATLYGDATAQAWTDTTITLLLSVASVNCTIWVL